MTMTMTVIMTIVILTTIIMRIVNKIQILGIIMKAVTVLMLEIDMIIIALRVMIKTVIMYPHY